MFVWFAIGAFIFGSSRLREGSLKFTFATLTIQGFFCLGKKMLKQNSKMVIYVGKMVTSLGKMIFLYYYFILSYNKLQQQIKLIAQCLYFLIRNNTCQSLCNTCDFCNVCHLQQEDKRRKVVAQKQQKTLNREHNQTARTDFIKMCRTGVKEVKVNAFKCVNFVSFGGLKNSSDT